MYYTLAWKTRAALRCHHGNRKHPRRTSLCNLRKQRTKRNVSTARRLGKTSFVDTGTNPFLFLLTELLMMWDILQSRVSQHVEAWRKARKHLECLHGTFFLDRYLLERSMMSPGTMHIHDFDTIHNFHALCSHNCEPRCNLLPSRVSQLAGLDQSMPLLRRTHKYPGPCTKYRQISENIRHRNLNLHILNISLALLCNRNERNMRL